MPKFIEVKPIYVDPSKRYLVDSYPAQGLYEIGIDLFVVTNVVVSIAGGAALASQSATPPQASPVDPGNQRLAVSEDLLLRLVAVAQQPDLAKDLTT